MENTDQNQQNIPLSEGSSIPKAENDNKTTTRTQESPTQLSHILFDEQAEESEGSIPGSYTQRTLRQCPEHVQDASYTAHTHASKAKSTDKVELAQSRTNQHGGLKEPLGGLDVALGDRDNAVRRQKDERNLPPASSTSSPGNIKRDVYGTPQAKHGSPGGTPTGDASSCSVSPGETTLCGESPEKAVIMRALEVDSLESDVGSLMGNGGGEEVRSEVTDNGDGAEGLTDMEKVDALDGDLLDSIQDAKTDPISQEVERKDTEPVSFKGLENVKTLLARVKDLKAENAQLKQDVQAKSEAEAEATNNLERLRSDVKKMATTLNQTSLSDSHKTLPARTPRTPRTPTSLTSGVYFDPDAGKLHSALGQLTQQFDRTSQSLSAQTLQLQSSLVEKEKQLSIAITALEASKIASLPASIPSSQPSGHDNWESRYKTERAQKEACERKIALLKRLAEETYRPDLEKENRNLRLELQELKDKLSSLREKAQADAARATHWQRECKLTSTRAEKESVGLQDTIQQQTNEMRAYIQAYHDKTQDPAHWDVGALQARVAALEHDGKTTEGLLSFASSVKARLEDEVRRLMDEVKGLKGENRKLGDVWLLGGRAPILPGRRTSSTVVPGEEQKAKLVHLCFHPHMVAAREAKVQAFRAVRKEERKEDAALAEVMTKLRKWKMSKEGKGKTGKEAYEKRSAWNLWDGEAWLAEGASAEEEKAVRDLRESGVLHGLEKRERG
jgi:hypothetical protein